MDGAGGRNVPGGGGRGFLIVVVVHGRTASTGCCDVGLGTVAVVHFTVVGDGWWRCEGVLLVRGVGTLSRRWH